MGIIDLIQWCAIIILALIVLVQSVDLAHTRKDFKDRMYSLATIVAYIGNKQGYKGIFTKISNVYRNEIHWLDILEKNEESEE